MRAMGARCIQPAFPTTAKKEEDDVGVLLVIQLSTEKTAWKSCQNSKCVYDSQFIKTSQTPAMNNCITNKFHSLLCS